MSSFSAKLRINSGPTQDDNNPNTLLENAPCSVSDLIIHMTKVVHTVLAHLPKQSIGDL